MNWEVIQAGNLSTREETGGGVFRRELSFPSTSIMITQPEWES
jgi:hypothetical protein